MLLLAAPATAPASTSGFPSVSVDNAVAEILRSQKVPSAVVEVAFGDRVAYARAFGMRDVARKLPADLQTRYEIGSMTKQFTAAAILQLQEAGKLSIDDAVSRYLPGAPHASRITIRQLLSQRSGLYDYLNHGTSRQRMLQESSSGGGYSAVVALIKGKPLAFQPGSRFDYSNTNYILLGRIVEVTSHQNYVDYLREHEWIPARMTHTSTIPYEGGLSDMAVGYWRKGGRPAPALPSLFAWADGDLVSTADDLIRWNEALTGGDIIAPKDYALMTQATSATLEDPSSRDPRYYAFGLEVAKMYGQPKIEHGGSTLGFHSYGVYFPDQHMRIVVLATYSQEIPEIIANKVFELAYPQIVAAYGHSAYRSATGEDTAMTARFRAFTASLLQGRLDRSQLAPALSKQYSDDLVKMLAAQGESFGPILRFVYKGEHGSANGTVYQYVVHFEHGDATATFTLDAAKVITDFDLSKL